MSEVNVRAKKKLDFQIDGELIRGIKIWYEEDLDDVNLIGKAVKTHFIKCEDKDELEKKFENTCKVIPGTYDVSLSILPTAKSHKVIITGFTYIPEKKAS